MDGIQRLQTHKRLHKHTHTHMFKVTLIGWGRLTWRSHYEGLSGVDWCVGHSFEMPCVALIKITNEKIHNTPSVAWNYSLYCCNGRDFISFFFFDNTAIELNWNDIKWNHVFFNWYWNIPGNKNYEIRLQISWFLYELLFWGYWMFCLCLTLASISGYCACMCSWYYSSIFCHVWKKATSRSFGGWPSQSDSPSCPQRSGLPVSQALDHW